MGSVYAEKMRKIRDPKIGLLNNGEEPGKGNELVRGTYGLLEKSGLNFIGNVEPKDVFAGKADVVIADGFTGNILIKTSEAAARMLLDLLKKGLLSSTLSKVGAMLSKNAFSEVKAKLDPNEIGAAPLLGIDGLSFVGHGGSNSAALVSGMKLIREAIAIDLITQIRETIQNKLSA